MLLGISFDFFSFVFEMECVYATFLFSAVSPRALVINRNVYAPSSHPDGVLSGQIAKGGFIDGESGERWVVVIRCTAQTGLSVYPVVSYQSLASSRSKFAGQWTELTRKWSWQHVNIIKDIAVIMKISTNSDSIGALVQLKPGNQYLCHSVILWGVKIKQPTYSSGGDNARLCRLVREGELSPCALIVAATAAPRKLLTLPTPGWWLHIST